MRTGRKKNCKGSIGLEVLLLLFGVAAIGVALYQVLPDYLDKQKSAQTYERLEQAYLKERKPEKDLGQDTEADPKEKKKDWWYTDVTVAFDELKKENGEIIGWLRFDDADDLKISYPVLYSGDDEKYLRSDLYGEEHIAGSIFLEGKNQPDFSDYYAVIYGHNMRDGSMFGDLDLYKETGFWEQHPYFTLYTEERAYRYEIFSSETASGSSGVFRVGYIPGMEYENFIQEMVDHSLIQTGIHPKRDARILTLSTCTGNGYDSRMVVHAVCVDEQTTDQTKLI